MNLQSSLRVTAFGGAEAAESRQYCLPGCNNRATREVAISERDDLENFPE